MSSADSAIAKVGRRKVFKMEANDPTLLGVVVVMAMALVELTKTLITRLTKKNGHCGLSPVEHDAIIGMHATMSKLDSDGVPMVYTKRSYEEIQEKILDVCRESMNIQRSMLDIMNRIDRRSSVLPGPR